MIRVEEHLTYEDIANAKIPLNNTRYVRFTTTGYELLQDALDQNLVPRSQLLTPGDFTFPQVCPRRIESSRSGWFWAFGYWIVYSEGEVVARRENSTHAPQVLMGNSQVNTLAVYFEAGGPPQDTSGWSVYPMWAETGLPLLGPFIESVTDPASPTDLDAGFVSTETVGQVIVAKPMIAPPFFAHQFQSWSNLSNPTPGFVYNLSPRNLFAAKGTAGLALAWYKSKTPVRPPDEGRGSGGDPLLERLLGRLDGLQAEVRDLRALIGGQSSVKVDGRDS